MRVVPVEMIPPELRAMDAVAEKYLMHVHQMHLGMFVGAIFDGCVVGRQNFYCIGPMWQASALGIAHAIGWVKDVCQKDITATGKPIFGLRDDFFQLARKVFHPRLGLLPCCAIHGFLARCRAAIVVDDVIASGGHDHDATHGDIVGG